MPTIISKVVPVNVQARYGVAVVSIQFISETQRMTVEINGICLEDATNMLQGALDLITGKNTQKEKQSDQTEAVNG